MTRTILFFIAITIATANGGTIATKGTQGPSDTNRNVTKREVLEFYPDWVPFKNKHGDELGEFLDVTKPKAKVKKRLALPMNFLMRAVSDDIEDLGQGDSDDDYDKKDTADNTGESVIPSKTSDIDRLIQIITQDSPSLADDINKSITKPTNEYQDKARDNITVKNAEEITTPEPEVTVEEKFKWKEHSDEEYEDYTEPTTTTKKPELSEVEQKENERRKKIILNSVDRLKQRHENEQRAISKKAIDEENGDDENKTQHPKTTSSEYDEYDGIESEEDKYHIKVEPKVTTEYPTTPHPPPTTTEASTRKVSYSPERIKHSERYSVFKNPNLYTIADEVVDNDRLPKLITSSPRRFSSKYVSTTPNIDSEENNIYPTRSSIFMETGEPMLYFPKIKPKKKSKNQEFATTTTTAPDTSVAETVEDELINKETTLPIVYPTSAWNDIEDEQKENKEDNKTVDTTTTAPEEFTSPEEAIETGPSGEAASSNRELVADAVPASSDHAKEEPKDYHVEKGGGHEHHSSFEEEHEEHGKKAYEGLHKDSKTKKGHHDKENHLGKYEDRGGHEKEHHDESGHYGAHHHEEHGKKHAKYEESGKHSKGHSTKGSHDIHKKEEYEKNVEFFEEEGDSGEEEKHGGYHNEKEHKSGGHFKKGNLHNDHHEQKKGESGHFVKGGHVDVDKGHKSSGGHDGHGRHGNAHHAAGGHQSGKKWVYHHGHPAKNANLIVIDRRADKYMHGPSYYG